MCDGASKPPSVFVAFDYACLTLASGKMPVSQNSLQTSAVKRHNTAKVFRFCCIAQVLTSP